MESLGSEVVWKAAKPLLQAYIPLKTSRRAKDKNFLEGCVDAAKRDEQMERASGERPYFFVSDHIFIYICVIYFDS